MTIISGLMRALLLVVMAAILSATSPAGAQTAQQVKIINSIRNATTMTYSPGHGTQIEFTASDGRTYLWYPGNRGIVRGQYKIDNMTYRLDERPNSPMVSIAAMCFRYGANTYNPITSQQGGGWECAPLSIYADSRKAIRKGDIFGLSKRRAVPFVLDKKQTKFAELLKKCEDC